MPRPLIRSLVLCGQSTARLWPRVPSIADLSITSMLGLSTSGHLSLVIVPRTPEHYLENPNAKEKEIENVHLCCSHFLIFFSFYILHISWAYWATTDATQSLLLAEFQRPIVVPRVEPRSFVCKANTIFPVPCWPCCLLFREASPHSFVLTTYSCHYVQGSPFIYWEMPGTKPR